MVQLASPYRMTYVIRVHLPAPEAPELSSCSLASLHPISPLVTATTTGRNNRPRSSSSGLGRRPRNTAATLIVKRVPLDPKIKFYLGETEVWGS